MYAKCGMMMDSRMLFEEIKERNAVSWNVLFSCYTRNDFFSEAMCMFYDMIDSGVRPDEYSLSNILNACTGLGAIVGGKKIYGYLVKLGYGYDPFSSNALVDMYAKGGDFKDAVRAFEGIVAPDVVLLNAIIAGCALHECQRQGIDMLNRMRRSGIWSNMFTLSSALKACASLELPELGKALHSLLIKKDVILDSCVSVGLIDMYCKCDLTKDARLIYALMPGKDLFALNAMISGYSQIESEDACLDLFIQTCTQGIGFDQKTLLAILNSAAGFQADSVCKQVLELSVKSGFLCDTFVVNSLVDSYGKCSQLDAAARIFDECPTLDLPSFYLSYNSLCSTRSR
ncbi:hypothetical protein P3S67_031661 [Capsicum chacoense]